MGLLSKLFKREHSPPLPDVNDMSIADVWIEFSTKVKYKNGVLLTAYIQSNGWHEMTKWFAPPTDCPVAKAIMRTLVRLNREGHFLSSGLELAYVADAPSLPKTPPETTVACLEKLCLLYHIPIDLYYHNDNQPPDNWSKMTLALD